MSRAVLKFIVKLRMFYCDIRGHHGKRWDYEPSEHYMRKKQNEKIKDVHQKDSKLDYKRIRMKISDKTEVSMPVKNMVGSVVAVAMGVFAYTEVTARLT